MAEETGWSAQDCLNHKLTFKKREDIKVTKDTLLQHIKRLRALGWHLLLIRCYKASYDYQAEFLYWLRFLTFLSIQGEA